jgi:FtsH-binding integral membrane protein
MAMAEQKGRKVGAILIASVSTLLVGGGCGYYGYTTYRGRGIGSALGSAALILTAFWLFGGLHFYGP